MENTTVDRQETVKKWLKDPLNLALLGVLAFGTLVRFYFYNMTKGQAAWWDEAAYGMLAKNFASGGIWDSVDIIVSEKLIRPPLFPTLWGILLKLGANEALVRFVLLFIPSVISVYFMYAAVKEIYGKRTAVFASLIFSSLWIQLFYSSRLLTDIPALAFLIVSVCFFLKATKGEFNGMNFGIAIAAACVSTLLRYPQGLIFFVYLAFLALTFRVDLLKKKIFWSWGAAGMIPLGIFFLYNFIKSGNIFPALLGSDYVQEVNQQFAFYILSFIPTYLKGIFFVFMLIGTAMTLFELFLGYDLLRKSKRLQGHLMMILLLGVFYSYFIFFLKGAEDRWLLASSIPLAALAGYGINFVYEKARKYSKNIALILIGIILLLGIYTPNSLCLNDNKLCSELTFANTIIKERSTSFAQMKAGLEWIKADSSTQSVVLGRGHEVYSMYYAERRYANLPANESELDNVEGDYLIAHMFAPQPAYLNEYVNAEGWKPVSAFFLDQEQKQPAFIVYKRE